ncbi:MAG TPA: alpha/beta hydrolase [Phenylobacterium sp.]|uniref:alpha/beta hydrolase n=1 Tax=Phenylobacterium sp. TaxID=1871053 RepID=UPI002C1D2999|nr:alpha/beta hydrolase [Phenylobacterium sp.]HSV04697.1 alpha/beta hydrolase [Phenylobacterium sp.]
MSEIDPHFRSHLEAQAKAAAETPLPPIDELPPEMVRAGYRAQRQSQDQNAPRDVDIRDFALPGPHGEIPVRLYEPQGLGKPSGLLVYFHGGGWVIGDLETHDGHCRRMARWGSCRVMAVDYRLAPEHPFPKGHDDALAAARWAFDHAGEIGVDRTRIAVGGDSAGGNLAATVAIDLKDDPDRHLAFQLLLYPATSSEWTTPSRRTLDGPILSFQAMRWFEKMLAAAGHPEAHRLSPIDRELRGAAPALIVTAGHDCLKDEGYAYAERLKQAGVEARHVEYPHLPHDFYIMADVSPAVVEAAKQTAAALKTAIG